MSTPAPRAVSHAEEDYLKAIYLLQEKLMVVSTTALSKAIGHSPAAATKMLKTLSERKLVIHTPYYGARLTPSGAKAALEVIRHHRLLELYLHEALGYGWDEVDAEAERLEHHISEDFEDRIAELLKNPSIDPHGHPIPTRDGVMPPSVAEPLAEAVPGEQLSVSQVNDENPEILRDLSRRGIGLGTRFHLESRDEISGTFSLRMGSIEITLSPEIAAAISVERTGTIDGAHSEVTE